MRIRTIGILATASLAVSACGSTGGSAATKPRPPSPVNLTVYVNDSKVSVSPTSVGAGPVVFIVTNQARNAESLAISRSGASHPIASTAPINPQGTATVSVDFKPGEYTIATAPHGSTDASLSQPSNIRSAAIHIGRERASSGSDLLQP
jgi:hypothetical protein